MKKALILVMALMTLMMMATLALASRAYADSIKPSWKPPTTNVDGRRLTVLAGYYLYMDGSKLETITEPAASFHVISVTIAEGQHSFTLTAFDTSGNESAPSNEVPAVIKIPPGNTMNLILRILK